MSCHWQSELWDKEMVTGNGGYITLTRLPLMGIGVMLTAHLCECSHDPRLLDTTLRGELLFPAAVARLLIATSFTTTPPSCYCTTETRIERTIYRRRSSPTTSQEES